MSARACVRVAQVLLSIASLFDFNRFNCQSRLRSFLHCFPFRLTSLLLLSGLGRSAFTSDFGPTISPCPPDDRRSVRNSSKDHPLFRKDALMQPFRQGHVVSDGDADGSAPSRLRASPSGNYVVAPVNEPQYID